MKRTIILTNESDKAAFEQACAELDIKQLQVVGGYEVQYSTEFELYALGRCVQANKELVNLNARKTMLEQAIR